MSERVEYLKTKNKSDAYKSVKSAIGPDVMEKFKVKADFDYYDDAYQIEAKGKGFNVVFKFSDSSVDVNLDLSLLLRPFKGKIWEILRREIERVV